jgi:hypothetical protein
MEEVQKQIRNPWATLIAGLVVGALFGLVVLGWWLFPVEWVDGSPSDLTTSYQQQWVEMAINEYALTGDVFLAQERYNALGDNKQDILVTTGSNLGLIPVDTYAAYVMAVEPDNATSIVLGTPAAPSGTDTGTSNLTSTLLPILCGVLVAVAAAIGIYFILKRIPPKQKTETTAVPVDRSEAVPAGPTTVVDPPIAQFISNYNLGDDLYDDSFSVDSPTGEFLGECGAGISEPIGVGDPKKVTAFEVWLFDKNDIQTVTKVLMSAHAYQDDTTRNRLATKGEPIIAIPGTDITLETQSLQMVVRVIDMAYGEGPLPPESFFDRLVFELSVWKK